MTKTATASPSRTRPKRLSMAQLALLPIWLLVLCGYLLTMLWTIKISFTNSKQFPNGAYVGLKQYERLWLDDRWSLSVQHIVIFGGLFLIFCMGFGLLLAIAIDKKVKGEDFLRTIILYPYAMSFIVTGLVWQWLMNPEFGLQNTMHALGWTSFRFDWAVNPDMAIYALVIAAVWQSTGLVMAMLLAGLRGIDPELRKAAMVDGIPAWRYYVFIVIPLLRPMIITAFVLLAMGVVKAYDLVVALTRGGPGLATEVPAKYVITFMFERVNIGLATAAATLMLLATLAVLTPYLWHEYLRPAARAGR